MNGSGRASANTTPYEAFGREIRLRLARSQVMDWLTALGAEDTAIAKEACRALAMRYRLDADRQRCPIVRNFAIESAEKFERMAADLEQHPAPIGATLSRPAR